MFRMKVWLQATRPKTLPASVSPILLGSALAYSQGYFQMTIWLVASICALALQVAVNFANDLFDAQSGVDNNARLGPARMVQTGQLSPKAMAVGLLIACLVALVSGLALVWLSSPWLLLLGAACLIGVFAYSAGPFPLASHALGEFTVLVFFGWVALAGTYFLHAAQVSLEVMIVATSAGLLSAAIMLVNNLRDIETDKRAGKITLAVLLGDERSRVFYEGMLLTAVGLHIAYSTATWFGYLLPLVLTLPVTLLLLRRAARWQGRQLNQLLSNTAQLLLLYCAAFSAQLFFLH